MLANGADIYSLEFFVALSGLAASSLLSAEVITTVMQDFMTPIIQLFVDLFVVCNPSGF